MLTLSSLYLFKSRSSTSQIQVTVPNTILSVFACTDLEAPPLRFSTLRLETRTLLRVALITCVSAQALLYSMFAPRLKGV
jgi:hypothetical protein